MYTEGLISGCAFLVHFRLTIQFVQFSFLLFILFIQKVGFGEKQAGK